MNGWALAADALVVAHLAFVAFAFGGALLVLRWPRLAFAQLPAAAWAVWIELSGRICPLTPLEMRWRRFAGEAGYEGGFVEHYVLPILYPPGLTPTVQVVLGVLVLAVNGALYALLIRRRLRTGRFVLDTRSP